MGVAHDKHRLDSAASGSAASLLLLLLLFVIVSASTAQDAGTDAAGAGRRQGTAAAAAAAASSISAACNTVAASAVPRAATIWRKTPSVVDIFFPKVVYLAESIPYCIGYWWYSATLASRFAIVLGYYGWYSDTSASQFPIVLACLGESILYCTGTRIPRRDEYLLYSVTSGTRIH